MEDNKEITPEMKKILESVYRYQEKASYTPEEIEMAKEMFDKPEKFALLRKILQVFTHEERGISLPTKEALLGKPEDLAKYGLNMAIETLADERVRQSLLSFYFLMKGEFQADKKEELEAAEKEKFEEEKRSEEFKENQEVENRKVGPNL